MPGMTSITLRCTTADDRAALLALYPRAFPDEDLVPLVSSLLDGAHPVLSLAAITDSGLAGHIMFTLCGDRAALLAPLAVDPAQQRRGVGATLVREGFARLKRQGTAQVFVLGDPGYYSRFGFAPEARVLPPYPMPPEWANAWQSLALPGGTPVPPGPLELPPLWLQPALWQP